MQTLLDRNIDRLVFEPPELGCVLYLPELPGSGSRIYDRSPYGNVGTIVGATWKRLPSGLWYLDSDGVDDTIDFGTILTTSVTELTIKVWVNPRVIASDDGLLRIGTNALYGKVLAIFYNSGIYCGINNSYNRVSYGVSVDEWIQIALQFSQPTLLELFLNGVKVDENNSVQSSIDFSGANDGVLEWGRYSDRELDGGTTLLSVYMNKLGALKINESFHREKHLFGVW